MKKLLLCVALFAFYPETQAQTLPSEMHYSADGRILYTGGEAPTGLYDRTVIRNVYLNFAQTNYWTLLTNNYASETEIPASMTIDGTTYADVGVRFRGNTSYTTIGTSQKKSFAISSDFVNADQTIMGYKNLKFNNAHQDATFMREVLYNRMARRHTPIAKGNYVHLYLNNQDWGIYPNVQSVDKTFLDEWFLSNDGARFRATTEETGSGGPGGGWGDGTAGMNYLGADTLSYKNYYSLKSSDISYPWQKLLNATQVLSTASAANMETVKTAVDVDKALWFLACENIFADDDSYIMKGKMDYMIYYEPETGRTTPLEYDGNSTFLTEAATSASWGPFKNATNANYPLLYKLLNIPQWRQRYLAHYRTILNETFTTANATTIVDEMNAQISALVASDPKKLYTTAQYTSGVPALKTFVTNRRNYLLTNTEVAQVAPTIASAPYYNTSDVQYEAPLANQQARIKASVTSANGISKVNLYYATGVVGNFTATQMFDDGLHNDGAASDGVFGASIPGYEANTFVRYYIEAIANNTALSVSYLPTGAEHDIFVYTVAAAQIANGVVINEFMASNSAGNTDEAGEFEDWIELYNNNEIGIDLNGFHLTDDTSDLDKWTFPSGTTIAAHGYLIVWADNETADGSLHASWKLSADGEDLVLSDSALNIVDSYTFGAQSTNIASARIPNGTGDLVMQAATFNANNESLGVETQTLHSLVIYPNPANTIVNVKGSDNLIGQKIELYNALGQKLYENTITAEMQIATDRFATGIYYLKIGSLTKKLSIRH
ncbi:CotH kinase family protein [Flavobacterium sp. MAH-1]|uniref:CotH kinase family protein n=1 Tax=Flavobacterium agri TaxID=2743471 RepID=A0A7Y9C6W6_9FLAO|nr:CotH kinase family protein [Flavobacterium agri]NUY81830.1 CotH kinase family protein [Flavobacterium agri]NYA71854.1 CotH kinase family protein [Flavobacterium agri]